LRDCQGSGSASWRNTTHDWSKSLDVEHLESIRRQPAAFAPGGTAHLVLEVLAYCADEAQSAGGGYATVVLCADGSVVIADGGRGTDTRRDGHGHTVKKPVMSTADLRFFNASEPVLLPDGHPRRGMSVVAALSAWLVHTNHRRNGSLTQRYKHGGPVTDLNPVLTDGAMGTTVHFLPDPTLVAAMHVTASELSQVARSLSGHLTTVVVHGS